MEEAFSELYLHTYECSFGPLSDCLLNIGLHLEHASLLGIHCARNFALLHLDTHLVHNSQRMRPKIFIKIDDHAARQCCVWAPLELPY